MQKMRLLKGAFIPLLLTGDCMSPKVMVQKARLPSCGWQTHTKPSLKRLCQGLSGHGKGAKELLLKLLSSIVSLVSRWEVRSGVTSRCCLRLKIPAESKAAISPTPLKLHPERRTDPAWFVCCDEGKWELRAWVWEVKTEMWGWGECKQIHACMGLPFSGSRSLSLYVCERSAQKYSPVSFIFLLLPEISFTLVIHKTSGCGGG